MGGKKLCCLKTDDEILDRDNEDCKNCETVYPVEIDLYFIF